MKKQTSHYARIEWKPLSAEVRQRAAARSSATQDEGTDALMAAAERFGVPIATGSPKEAANLLLGAAAEIEQQLMVEYLYGYFSAGDAPTDWLSMLRIVFKEEMGHLLTVQNLLLLTKNLPHLARMSGVAQPYEPFPLRLEPLSRSSVAKYVSAESPAPASLPDDVRADALQALDEAKAAGFTGNRVGLLYAAIYWLLQKDETPAPPWNIPAGMYPDKHLDDADFAAGSLAFQGLPGDWQAQAAPQPSAGFFVAQASDRTGALNAVYEVAQQGEGIVTLAANEPSHFQQFLKLYRAIVAATTPLPIRPVPVNPTFGTEVLPDAAAEENRISEPNAQGLSELADLHYVILLGCIHLSLLAPASQTGEPFRQALARHAISAEMRHALGALGRSLSTMPRKPGDAAGMRAAGIPFSTPELPETEDQTALAQFLLDRLLQSDQLIELVLPHLPPALVQTVTTIKNDGTKLRTLLGQVPVA